MRINETKEVKYLGNSDTVPVWSNSNPELVSLEAVNSHTVLVRALALGEAVVNVKVNSDTGSGVSERVISYAVSIDGELEAVEQKSEPTDKYWKAGS